MQDQQMIEHRLTQIENDLMWLKKLNWIVLSTTIANAMVTIVKI